MIVSDTDLELLEEHLDGALDAAASTALTRRLAVDASLAAALAELKSQRAVRSAVWQAMEPNTVAADRLLWRVKGAIAAQQRAADLAVTATPVAVKTWNRWRFAQFGSAAAACMMLGFLVGRVGQSGSLIHPHSTNIDSGNVASNITPGEGKFTATGRTPQVLVPISNEYGQVTLQPFDSAEQAKSFEEDLHQAQGGSMNPALNVAPKLASQEHF